MEPSRKQLIERIEAGYEAFNRGDFEAASTLFHPDIVWNRVAEVERPVRGAEAARGLIEPQVFATQRNGIHSERADALAAAGPTVRDDGRVS